MDYIENKATTKDCQDDYQLFLLHWKSVSSNSI